MFKFQNPWFFSVAVLVVILAGCQQSTSSNNSDTAFVRNGSFSSGTTDWFLNLSKNWGGSGTGDGTMAVENGVLHEVTLDVGQAYSDVQVQQTTPGFPLIAGKSYRVTFTAWADTAKQMDVSVWENGIDTNSDGFDWSTYGYKAVTLSTDAQVFTYDFIPDYSNTTAGICFFCGYALGDIYLDNISVVALAP